MQEASGTIAIVEDDASMGRSIMRLLNAHGFATEVYPSAEAFLGSHAPTSASCLVLDIHLRGMSGIELSCHLQASGSKVPVIFITAIDDEALKREAMAAGCVAYLHKPFPAQSLTGAVRTALAGRI